MMLCKGGNRPIRYDQKRLCLFSKVEQKVSAFRWALSLDTLIDFAQQTLFSVWYLQSLTEQPTFCTQEQFLFSVMGIIPPHRITFRQKEYLRERKKYTGKVSV